MKPTILHVMNHTHWDREWFAPYVFTGRWIPLLIHNLEKVVAANPDYAFLLDAQTCVIEDLQMIDRDAYATACRLIRNKNLRIGPYYAQLETRLSGAESLVRNIRIGVTKARELGGSTDFAAWNVDAFGHLSQSPQIHGLFGIDNMYLWRGVAQLQPYFWWQGADGTTMLVMDLFAGGYRNFYKVTSNDHLALARLKHEVKKLRPYYKYGHIPVFDGYDLDNEPGDAAGYFAANYGDWLQENAVQVINSSPNEFARTIRSQKLRLPELAGELMTGKYVSVFPGTLSSRVYSKLAVDYSERLLYRYAEPLQLLLSKSRSSETFFEAQTKSILQNLVHDVISGCSIDQVHEIAELRSLNTVKRLRQKIISELKLGAAALKDGTYAYLPAIGATAAQIAQADKLYHVEGQGVGIARVAQATSLPCSSRTVTSFAWKNRHYALTLEQDGRVKLGSGKFGQLVVRREAGDTYWDEPRGEVEQLNITSALTVDKETSNYAQVSFSAQLAAKKYVIDAQITLTFDDSACIRWLIRLTTNGSDFSVLLRHDYGRAIAKLNAGMPFDNVERPFEDKTLLGRHLDPALTSVLVGSGQRDLLQTFTFPFHGYVTPAVNDEGVHLLAKGLRAYQTERPGCVDLVLQRSVEWLMRPSQHRYHSGDAGPKFYVPDARGQRQITIECALLVSPAGPDELSFHQAVDQYLNPPLLFEVKNSAGTASELPIFTESLPLTSLRRSDGKPMARVFNPTTRPAALQHTYHSHDETDNEPHQLNSLAAKKITILDLQESALPQAKPAGKASVKLINWPDYPTGPDLSKPDPAKLTLLQSMEAELQAELDELSARIDRMNQDPSQTVPSSLQHRYYVVARERMEAQLSLLWNRQRAAREGVITEAYAYAIDEDLYALVTHYNDLRIMRRMYDYIIDIDSSGQPEARPALHKK